MLRSQEVDLNGTQYLWQFDESMKSPDSCWLWTNPQWNMKVSKSVEIHLNRKFIEDHAKDMAVDLKPVHQKFFKEILEFMGATLEQICDILGTDPKTSPELFPHQRKQLVEPMPPATHTPFNSRPLRDYFFGLSHSPTPPPPTEAGILGFGPFNSEDIRTFLNQQEVACHDIDSNTSVVVLGREGWDENQIDNLIDSRVGQSLKIYSQEMFVTFLGKPAADPFYQGPLVLEAFKEGHDGLEFISRGWSGWVQTYVRDDWKNQPVGLGSCDGWEKESPLHIMGYHVGKTGQYIDKRRQILRNVFEGPLPIVSSYSYMAEWGEPGSAERLYKTAERISLNCKNSKRKSNQPLRAIRR